MQLDWGRFRTGAGAALGVARKVLGTAALVGLAVLLAAQAASARREREVVARECATIDRDIERLKRSNQALRDEMRALDSDPVYVEALLRRWKMIGPSEKNVE